MAQWEEVWEKASQELRHDAQAMNAELARWEGKTMETAGQIYDTYLVTYGKTEGVETYSDVTGLLVAWYIDQYRPDTEPETEPFDPTDYEEVFPTEPPQETTAPTEP